MNNAQNTTTMNNATTTTAFRRPANTVHIEYANGKFDLCECPNAKWSSRVLNDVVNHFIATGANVQCHEFDADNHKLFIINVNGERNIIRIWK